MNDRIVDRQHPEYTANATRWRWLLDSLEGGETYRDAEYGIDLYRFPVRNLIRHKREYPPAGPGGSASRLDLRTNVEATDNDYELRRARTPVPTFVAEVVEDHLSRIYSHEVERTSSGDRLAEFWKDVDGTGIPIDRFMSETVAPLLYTLGQIDLLVDHPVAPAGEVVATRADQERLDLGRAVASVVLPDRVRWWRLDPATKRYLEVLISEVELDDDGKEEVRFRLWNSAGWILFDDKGKEIGRGDHAFGRVPIVRVFDRRKYRCENVGQSRLEATAERMREYYNKDSESVLSDSIQAHPTLSGPEEYLTPEAEVPVGPGFALPMKRTADGSYQGWAFIEPPKGGAESIRANKREIRDAIDRENCLAKPAGSASTGGSGGSTVAQSGVSKSFDHVALNNRLSRLADVLQSAEMTLARLAWVVLTDGTEAPETEDAIVVRYSKEFDLLSSDELAKAIVELQSILSTAGAAPETELALVKAYVRQILPGLDDATYESLDDELEAAIGEAATRREQQAEAALAGSVAGADPSTSGGEMNNGSGNQPNADPSASANAGA